MMAGVGRGLFDNLKNAAQNFVPMDRMFEPDHGEADRHANNFGKYQLLYQ